MNDNTFETMLMDTARNGGVASPLIGDILGRVSAHKEASLRLARSFLTSPDKVVQLLGIVILRALGKYAAPLIGDLKDLITKSEDTQVIRYMAEALAIACPDPPSFLMDLISDISPLRRHALVPAIVGSCKSNRGKCSFVLKALWLTESRQICMSAVVAIKEELGEDMVKEIDTLRVHESKIVRAYAAWAIAQFGSLGDDAVADLSTLILDSDPEVRFAAANALGCLEPLPEIVMDLLPQLALDEDPDVLYPAAKALSRISRHSSITTRLAVRLLKHSEHSIRVFAASALSRYVVKVDIDVAAIYHSLAQEDSLDVKMLIVVALSRLGAFARDSIATLRLELESSHDGEYRRVLEEAIAVLSVL